MSTDWAALSAAEPSAAVWQELCRIAENSAAEVIAEIAGHLRDWPAGLRPMPDRWWTQWTAGERQPWHALATHRTLCRAEYASVLAAPNDLSLLLIGEGSSSNSDQGDGWLLVPMTGADVTDVDAEDYSGWDLEGLSIASIGEQAADALFSPDGSRVTVAYEEEDTDPITFDREGESLYEFTVESDGAEPEQDAPHYWDNFERLGQSGDGRFLVAGRGSNGSVTVIDAETGDVVLQAGDATGPVALDWTGSRVAYAAPDGAVTVRDVASGEMLFSCVTGLSAIGALAFAPDGTGIVVAGAKPAGEDEQLAAIAILTLADNDCTGTEIRTASAVDAANMFFRFATKACWADRGPMVFIADDDHAYLMDWPDGRIRWTSTQPQTVGSFTPDGRVLIVSGNDINAWFL